MNNPQVTISLKLNIPIYEAMACRGPLKNHFGERNYAQCNQYGFIIWRIIIEKFQDEVDQQSWKKSCRNIFKMCKEQHLIELDTHEFKGGEEYIPRNGKIDDCKFFRTSKFFSRQA